MIEDTPINPPEVAGKLFSVGQITLATFLGAPIAGCLLLAKNYRVLGRTGAAWQSLWWGAISTSLILLISFWLPENFPNMVLPVAYCFGMRQFATYSQGDALSNHLQAGGRIGSWAVTVSLGIGCLLLIVGLIFGLVMVLHIE